MKTLKLKSILLGLMAVLVVAIVMTACEQEAINSVTETVTTEAEVLNTGTQHECYSECHVTPDYVTKITTKLPFAENETEVTVGIKDGIAYYEGDIMLGNLNNLEERGVASDIRRWTNSTIPYAIAGGFTNAEITKINNAAADITARTNLCVIPRTTETNFVTFVTSTGCSSFVGMQGGSQNINLASGCGFGSTIHELLHAAGIWHEQSREDRNNFVTINFDNITSGREHNFNQRTVNATDIGNYDYGSLMHYGSFAFSRNGQPTITAPTGVTIGQRSGLSAGDIATVNTIYPTACGDTPPANCELLTNGDFDSNLSDWESWNCTAFASGGAANLTSITTGANPWNAGLLQVGFTIQQGKTYTATFRARASSNRSIFVKTGITGSPWTSYFYEEVNLTTSMQTFNITFTMNNATDTNARFEFFVANASPSVYIDNVSLKESSCGGNNCPPAGTTCNDDNPATYNDVEDGNCNCAGTPCPAAGTSCNDGNPNTINDVEDGFCNCAGTPAPVGGCELLTNGGFDSNLSNWSSWNCTSSSSGGVANLTGIITGANPWNAGLVQVGFTLYQGKTYTATFRARAASNRSIFVKTGITGSPWTSYFYEEVNLTTSMQTFNITFTMDNATDTNARFEIFVANASSNVYIDNVSLEENDCGANCEILTNGGFDSNLSDWSAWNCTASSSGGVVNLTNVVTGANPWDAGLVQVGFTMEQGETYTATFRARADSNRPIFVKTGMTGTPWTSYFYEEVNLTTSMQTYTITFTMNGTTDTNARFEFFIGTDSPNVYIDNVSLSSDC